MNVFYLPELRYDFPLKAKNKLFFYIQPGFPQSVFPVNIKFSILISHQPQIKSECL